MDIESRKYKVIEKLLKVEEESTIYKLETILNDELVKDGWDELSPELQQALDISIGQSDRNEVIPHEQFMAEIKKKYNIA